MTEIYWAIYLKDCAPIVKSFCSPLRIVEVQAINGGNVEHVSKISRIEEFHWWLVFHICKPHEIRCQL